MRITIIYFNFARLLMTGILVFFCASWAMSQDVSNGFADVSGDGVSATTGGAGGDTVTVTNFADLQTNCNVSVPRTIIVAANIEGSGVCNIASNKTIKGANDNITLSGFTLNMNDVHNIIISDLKITGGTDGIAARNTDHLWVDHCEIWDCSDGLLDITLESSYCTVSWTKFYYVDQTDHRFACLIGSGGGDHPEDWGRLKVTYHHNWFGNKVDQRQPRLMYGQGHQYNNYYTTSGNNYCIGVGSYGSALIENNYFDHVNSPHTFMYEVYCYIEANDNIYDNCSGAKNEGLGGIRHVNDAVHQAMWPEPFDPPYSYFMDKAFNIPAIVSSYAGPRSSTTPIAASGVAVTSASDSVQIGAEIQLIETISPANASNRSVSWSSSDTLIAKVNSLGLVSGIAEGLATITVTSDDGGFTASSDIKVVIPVVTGVTVSPTSSTIHMDSTVQLTATVDPPNAINKYIRWSTDDASIATVNAFGLVTGVSGGVATITVTTDDGGYTATCEVTVSDPLSIPISNLNYESELDINCYPLPVENILNIEFSKELTEFVDIYLFDITGKAVKFDKANGSSHMLDMSDLPDGLYMLRVSGTNLNVVKHISK